LRDIENGNLIEVDDYVVVNMVSANNVILFSDYITTDAKNSYENVRYWYFKEVIKNNQESGNKLILELQRKQSDNK